MNNIIEQWRVEQFSANVYHLAQQKGSRIGGMVRSETFTGKAEFFDRLGLAEAVDKVGRNTDTPNLDIDHSRRMVTTITREWATLVDRKDKVQNIHNPESEYSVAAQNGLGRKMDKVLISAAFGKAASGEDGSTLVSLPNAQKVASVAGAALAAPGVQLLRQMKRKLDASEAVGPRYLVHDADFLQALLALTQVTSADYNTIRALVQGELDTFMGFKFIRTEFMGQQSLASAYDDLAFKYDVNTGLYSGAGTALAGTESTCLAFVGDGLLLGRNPNQIARVEERSDKGYSVQVYAAQDFGAVRMEEVKVVQGIYLAG